MKEIWFFSFPKLAEEKKFYAILGLNSNATIKEINKAYRKISLKLHPDRATGSQNTKKIKEEIFNSIEKIVDAKKHLNTDPIPKDRHEEIINALVYETKEEKQERITIEQTQQKALQNAIWIKENCLNTHIITQDFYLDTIGQLTEQNADV